MLNNYDQLLDQIRNQPDFLNEWLGNKLPDSAELTTIEQLQLEPEQIQRTCQ